jgi:protease I
MNDTLKDKRIAILVADGFEQIEMTSPRDALIAAGATTTLISPNDVTVQGFNHHDRGEKFHVDLTLKDARPENFDALVLPGGVMNPDQLRQDADAVRFVRAFFDRQKPVAAICHGPWTLIEADVVRGRQVTSWPSLKTDLKNAGAQWSDSEVVVDRGLVTGRKPADLPAFNAKMIELFAARPQPNRGQAEPASARPS